MKCYLNLKLLLADKFGEQQIFDLTKEIGLNERFLLTENLFSGIIFFQKH